MNKALLDTDTFSELGKAINPTVARNGAAYLKLAVVGGGNRAADCAVKHRTGSRPKAAIIHK